MVKFMMQRIFDILPHAETITSRANATVVSLGKLSLAKHRAEQGLFLAEGIKLSEEAAGMEEIRYILIRSDDGTADAHTLALARRAPRSARVLVLPTQVFEKISTENAPQGIITVLAPLSRIHRTLSAEDCDDIPVEKRILAVDSVQDPGNLGTIIRTAAAFGYERILLGHCADIYHPKTVRAAMGTLFRMPVDVCDSLTRRLLMIRKSGRRVLSAALGDNSLTLGQDPLRADDCIVIGNEGHGVRASILSASDGVIRIPMAPNTESLNAAGAAAVLMWEYYRTFG